MPIPTIYRQMSSGPVPFCYLHAGTYFLPANIFWPGTIWTPAHQYIHTLPVNIFWPGTVLLSAYQYLLLTGKYLLARYHFAVNIPIPTSYWLISSGPVPFCRQYTDTNIVPANIFWPSTIFALSILVPASSWQISSGPVPFCPQRTGTSSVPSNIFWPSTILPLAYWYQHLTGKYLLDQCHFALSVPVPAVYRQISSGPVPFCPQYTSTNILPETIYWPSTNLLSAYW